MKYFGVLKSAGVFVALFFANLLNAAGASPLIGLATGAHDIPEFIRQVPSEFSRTPVLINRSASRQAATPLKPRVLAFSGDTFFAYSGVEGSAGFNFIEVMDYDCAVARFNFYRIHFSADGVRVESNPEDCRTCHKGRPIWPSNFIHPAWPGMYGGGTAAVTGDRERDLLARFINGARTDPRYSVLPGLENFTPYFGASRGHVLFEHNGTFEKQLTGIMTHYLMARLAAGPRFTEARKGLIAALIYGFTSEIPMDPSQWDPAGELGPLLGVPEGEMRGWWADTRRRIEFEVTMQIRSKASRALRALDLPDGSDALVKSPEAGVVNALTGLAIVLRHFGYGDLLGEVFSNPGWLGYDIPGLNATWGLPGRLENQLVDASTSGPGWAAARRQRQYDFGWDEPFEFHHWSSVNAAREVLDAPAGPGCGRQLDGP